MNTIELYQHIKQKVKAEWMSELQQEPLTNLSSEPIDMHNAWQEIQAFAPTEGWIQTLDQVDLVDHFSLATETDPIVSAEMMNADGQTLHIRPANGGKVTRTTYSSEGDALFFYTETQHQIKVKKRTGVAKYRLYWALSAADAASKHNTQPPARQAQFSRFMGLELKENH